MTITASLNAEQLQSVARAAGAIARLPAVPTQHWCQDASTAVQHIRPSSFVLTTVLSHDSAEDGAPIIEATGGIAPAASSGKDDLARMHGDGVGAPGWRIADVLQGERTSTARLRDIASSSSWPLTLAGKRWKRLGVNELLVGAGCLHPENSNRVLIVELGAGADYPPFAQSDTLLLAAMLDLLTARAAAAFGYMPVSAASTVTPREEEILELLTLGYSVREIAERLKRSKHTVHDHVKSLHRKLGASSRGALIARFLGHPSGPIDVSVATSNPEIVTRVHSSISASA